MFDFNSTKTAVFSDIHFGAGRESSLKMDTAVSYIDWMIDEMQSRSVETVLFLGDWFDNRNTIGVPTINAAYDCLKKLSVRFHILLVIGNHDTNLKTSNDVNSIRVFQEIPNVDVIHEPVITSISGYDTLLCPWNMEIGDDSKRYEIAAGHFEFNGAALCGTVDKNRKYGMKDLGRLGTTILTGHYHIRKNYKMDDFTIMSVGSPFQLDWGDYGNTKGFHIIEPGMDLENRFTFVQNTVSPEHKIVLWSQKDEERSLTNSIVKLVVDDKYKYEEVVSLANRINEDKLAKPVEVEYAYSADAELLDVKNIREGGEIKLSTVDYIKKYVEKLDAKVLDDGERKDVMEMLAGYYKAAEEVVGDE